MPMCGVCDTTCCISILCVCALLECVANIRLVGLNIMLVICVDYVAVKFIFLVNFVGLEIFFDMHNAYYLWIR